eukprot:3261996-Ditylum_brightwellii.AAC.1
MSLKSTAEINMSCPPPAPDPAHSLPHLNRIASKLETPVVDPHRTLSTCLVKHNVWSRHHPAPDPALLIGN